MTDETTNNQQPITAPEAVAPAPAAVPAPVQTPPIPETRRDSRGPRRSFGGFGRGQGGGFGRGGQGGRGRGPRPQRTQEKPEYEQKTLDIARVARVTKGGKRFTFRTTICIGDMKGRVGVGIGKGKDVAQSIQKAYNQAKKNLITVVMENGTIPYSVTAKYSSAVVLLKPSRAGIKAGGAVRSVARLAGITSLTGKLTERTNNKLNIAMATIKALQQLRPRKQ